MKRINLELEFKQNREKDIANILKYKNKTLHGLEYRKIIERLHPKVYSYEHDEDIINYLNNYYEENQTSIISDMKETELIWNTIKEDFEKKLELIFPEVISLKIDVNPSIINNNPIFLEEQRFMYGFNLKTEEKRLVIVHELLHFAFREFLNKENIVLSEELFWKVLESFNYIILNKSEFKELISPLEEKSYPDIMKRESELKLIKNQNLNIVELSNKIKNMWR
ncbi:MAG: hypothetical protein KKF65_03495 [Nanoarchaeota archaeon]|nr:hypothetical protein [Nanoarchaeota archaeon]